MKYLITFVSILIFIPIKGKAQNEKVSIGLQAGISQIYHELEYKGTSNKELTGLTGITLRYEIDGNWYLRSGLIYERKGGRNTGEVKTPSQPDGTGTMYEIDIYFEYLTIPLFGEYKFSNDIPVFITAGAYTSIPISSRYELKESGSYVGFEARSTQFGVMAGLGAEFTFNDHLSLNIVINRKRGLTNPSITHVNPDSQHSTKLSLHTTSLAVIILYNF